MELNRDEKGYVRVANTLVSSEPDLLFENSAKATLKGLVATINRLSKNPSMSCEGCICEYSNRKDDRCQCCIRGRSQPDLFLRRENAYN